MANRQAYCIGRDKIITHMRAGKADAGRDQLAPASAAIRFPHVGLIAVEMQFNDFLN
jgi:hypothetical protein